jgi:hypothetical protein
MESTILTLKIIGRLLLITLRVTVLIIVLLLWITRLLPSGKPRSNCKIARALRSWALVGIKRSLPASVARHLH